MKFIIFFLTFYLIFLGRFCYSQENASSEEYTISTDRPSASFASSVVPKGILIGEFGYFNQTNNFDNSIKVIDQTLPNFTFRYGVNERFELRLGTDYYLNTLKSSIGSFNTSGLNPVQVGLKLHVQEEKGFIPQTTFLGSIQLAEIASKTLALDRNQAYFRLMFQNTISDKFFILYNLGMNFNNYDNQFVYTFLLGFVPMNNLTIFLESFGNKNSELNGMDNYAHIGAVYVIKNRYQLDATLGYLYTQNQQMTNLKSSIFLQLGFSTYLRFCKK